MNFNWIAFYTLLRREVGRTGRVIGQAVLAPLITATLYIFVFGYVVGSSIEEIAGLSYISFVFPGIVGMNVILTVFGATSFSIFFMKFQRTIEDLLTLPLSYTELVLSLIFSGVIRTFILMVMLAVVALFFGIASLAHPFILLWYVFLMSMFYGLLGLVIGIWADNSFEKVGLASNFILTPLTFLGGAFYSVHMLPENFQFLVYWNPIFYSIDGIRYALTGYHEASLLLGTGILTTLSLIVLALSVYIFRTGWKVRS